MGVDVGGILTKDYASVSSYDLQKIAEKIGDAFSDALEETYNYMKTKYASDSTRVTAVNCTTNLLVSPKAGTDDESFVSAVSKCVRSKVVTLSQEKADKVSEEVVKEYLKKLEEVGLRNAKRGPLARLIAKYARSAKGFLRYLFSFEVFAAATVYALYRVFRSKTIKVDGTVSSSTIADIIRQNYVRILEGPFSDITKVVGSGISKIGLGSVGGSSSVGVFVRTFIMMYIWILSLKMFALFFKGIGKILSSIPHIVTLFWSLPLKILRKVVISIYRGIRRLGSGGSEEEKQLIEIKLRRINSLVERYYYGW